MRKVLKDAAFEWRFTLYSKSGSVNPILSTDPSFGVLVKNPAGVVTPLQGLSITEDHVDITDDGTYDANFFKCTIAATYTATLGIVSVMAVHADAIPFYENIEVATSIVTAVYESEGVIV